MFTYPRCMAVAAALAMTLLAQDRPLTVGAPVVISKIVITPAFAPDSKTEKFLLAIEYSKVDAPPSGLVNLIQVASIEHDLLKGTGTVLVGAKLENGVMAGGVLYQEREVMDIIDALAMKIYREQFPGPLPVVRRPSDLVQRSADEARRSVRVP